MHLVTLVIVAFTGTAISQEAIEATITTDPTHATRQTKTVTPTDCLADAECGIQKRKCNDVHQSCLKQLRCADDHCSRSCVGQLGAHSNGYCTDPHICHCHNKKTLSTQDIVKSAAYAEPTVTIDSDAPIEPTFTAKSAEPIEPTNLAEFSETGEPKDPADYAAPVKPAIKITELVTVVKKRTTTPIGTLAPTNCIPPPACGAQPRICGGVYRECLQQLQCNNNHCSWYCVQQVAAYSNGFCTKDQCGPCRKKRSLATELNEYLVGRTAAAAEAFPTA